MNALSIIKNLPKTIVKTGGKILTKVKINQPQAMVWTGAGAVTAAIVIAFINARKIDPMMSVKESKLDEIQERKDIILADIPEEKEEERQLAVKDLDKEIAVVRMESAKEMIFLIGIPATLFLGGMALMIGGHRMLLRRFGQLSTAFATLKETFDRYRQMNIAEHGEECDRRYRYGIVGETTAEATVIDKNGKEKTVKCKVPVVDPDYAASMYTFEFSDNFSSRCPKDPVNTISFLRSQEKYWNTWMETHDKPVTLYEVLMELGYDIDMNDPSNDYIMIAGWRPNGDGDNRIDFGIMRAVNKPALSNLENTVFLNFNCDGNLYHSTRYSKDGRRIC